MTWGSPDFQISVKVDQGAAMLWLTTLFWFSTERQLVASYVEWDVGF